MTAVVAAMDRKELVSLSDQNLDESVTIPESAQARYELRSNGEAWAEYNIDPDEFLEDWGPGGGSFDCRATLVTGTLSSGSDPVSTWLALSSNRGWQVFVTSGNVKTCTIDVDIRKGVTILATARIILTAESS